MTQEQSRVPKRPERVIIVDADNPMVEIHGRFVWEDEHERVVAEIAERAYADGYKAGRSESRGQVTLRLRRRRSLIYYIRLTVVCVAALFVLLMLPVIFL